MFAKQEHDLDGEKLRDERRRNEKSIVHLKIVYKAEMRCTANRQRKLGM